MDLNGVTSKRPSTDSLINNMVTFTHKESELFLLCNVLTSNRTYSTLITVYDLLIKKIIGKYKYNIYS